VNLGVLDRFSICSVNVPIVGKFKSWKLNGNKKTC
jgi:hypothetical protein